MVCDLKSESPLIQAVFSGDVEKVLSLINSRVDINYQSQNGRLTALHAAAHCCENSSRTLIDDKDDNHNGEIEQNLSESAVNGANYVEILSILLKSGARVNSKDSKNLTPLHYACRSNSEEAVSILLEFSADVNARDKNWQSPLHICAMYNSVDSAKLMLPLMSNIDVSDRQSRSALAHAAFHGNLEMVELLLEKGANCNIHDKQERRPLHWASYVGYNEIIKILVKYGADINCLDKELYTPILVACASGKSEETISLLIELGSNYEATTVHDSSIFHLACLNGHDVIVKELLYKHNLSMKINNKGFHPIHYAAACKLGAFCLELLVSLEVDVNLASYVDGTTPMHVAALHGRTSCAQILYSNGALVNVKNSSNNTPLHLAALNGHTSMISFLIECGANIYIRGHNGMLAWAMATLNGHFECFKIIEQIIPTISSRKQFFETKDDFGRTFMHLAAISGNYECLNLFLKSDCNLNEIDDSGNTPLHYACVGSYLKCVELLIRAGAEVNEVNKTLRYFNRMDLPSKNEPILNMISANLNPCGCTPLMLACAFDSDGYVVRELILNAHARADLTDKYGYNALHYAAFQGNINVFEILLEQCKELDHQYNEKSISPLHILAYYGHREALEFLLKYFPDPDVQDKDGRTPLDLACYRGETSCVECLMLHNANYELRDMVNGRTSLHAAAFNNNDECLKIISLIVNSRTSSSNRLNETYDYFANANEDSNQANAFMNTKLANLRDKFNRTPLMIAVEQGHLNTINFLINQMGADVFATDDKNRTALHRAAALGYEECCVAILKTDCSSLMQRDLNGLLPVHYAMLAGHANLLFVFFEYYENYLELINNESDTNQSLDSLKPLDRLVDAKGFSLLHFSCFNGHSTCTETICDLGENYPFLIEMFVETDSDSNMYNKFSPLHCACFSSHDTCVSIVLEKFCDKSKTLIELEDQNGNRPLHICAMNNEYDCALLLIEANCSLNQPNLRGHTPFMLAAAYSSFNIMEMLLSDEREKKIDLSSTDLKGNTALHLALLNNHENCALFLLDKIEPSSLIVNQQNHQGQTPLHLAASKGYLTVVEILLSKGADIWIKNKRQQTPLVSCAKNEQTAECLNLMVSLLVSTLSQQSNKATAINKTNLMMMMMMMTPTAKTPSVKLQNNHRFINEQNNSSIIENKNDLLNDSTYTLTTSDVVLNDVNMNSTNNNINTNNLKSHEDTDPMNSSDHKVIAIQKSNKVQFNKRDNDTNLNSTLIFNDNEINGDNTSSSGTSSGTSSRSNSAVSSTERINHEVEEQEEGELIEDEDEDDEEDKTATIQLDEMARVKNEIENSDDKLIELVQTKSSPLKTIKTNSNSLFDSDFF